MLNIGRLVWLNYDVDLSAHGGRLFKKDEAMEVVAYSNGLPVLRSRDEFIMVNALSTTYREKFYADSR